MHQNIVQTFGLIEFGESGDEHFILLLEWIDGDTLEEWIKREKRRLQWSQVAVIALDILDAVEELHGAGIRHRDIKPENVMIRRGDGAVLMDIGVAEITGNDAHTLHTNIRDFIGSARYASPQFIRGEPFTVEDDIYSIGGTLHLLFTGKRIFDHVERKPLIPVAVITEGPRVAELRSDFPSSMKILLGGCLHRERERRPTLDELRKALNEPEESDYITKELDRQRAEETSYEVVQVLSDGAEFFADLRGDEPSLREVYKVVRSAGRVTLPSYGREVDAEVWVADAVLKHVGQGVGYFKVLGKRWQPPKFRIGGQLHELQGRWVDYEKVDRKVELKDCVVKREKP